MSGNIPYIGSKISLITTSDIRYEGILYTLNREESTIAVQNVRSFGTEGRRKPEVPMSNEIYDFIIFRGKDLKDLTVLQGAPERSSPFAMGAEFLDSHGSNLYSHPGAAPSEPCGPQSSAHSSMGGVFQRPSMGSSASSRNGGFPPSAPSLPMSNSYPAAGAYPSPTSSRSSPPEKPFGSRQSYSSSEPQQGPPMSPSPTRGPPALYEDDTGAESHGTSEDAKPNMPRGSSSGDASKGLLVEDRSADTKDQKTARGRGKGGSQKKLLFEVLRFHKRAEETIVKTMRSQNTASLQPSELRAMSEVNPSVYHFYLDFVNYCCPSHMAQSDEQQWESLCKALKKHFEKDFGAGQQQKPPQPQRPNNTLGDFITIDTNSKAAKKNAKAAQRGGSRQGRGSGRGEKKDQDGPNSGELDGPGGLPDDASQSTSWVCPRCTLRNENLLLECAACGTSKQQAALWAEFPPLG